MTTWNHSRQQSKWSRVGFIHWTNTFPSQAGTSGGSVRPIAYLSVIFSWALSAAHEKAQWYREKGYTVIAGGPAAYMQPDQLLDVAEIPDPTKLALSSAEWAGHDAIGRHNSSATLTTRGCLRRCHFCIVPKVEPKFEELDTWPLRPIVCDNNIVASSKVHFNKLVDSFKGLKDMDFQSGLDIRLLTKFHAERLAELDHRKVRLAWDNTKQERHFMRAFQILIHAGFPVRIMGVYVLIGYCDTPDDALYRLNKVRAMGAQPFPMRYQKLTAKKRNDYVGKNWTDTELKRFMRYWSQLSRTGGIPFEEFTPRGQEPPKDQRIRSL